MNLENIKRLMSLERKYLELHYLSLYYVSVGSDEAKKILEQKNQIEKEIEELNNKLSSLTIFYPFQASIEEYTNKIKNYKEEDIVNALRTKQGDLFNLIKNRGVLIKQNFERQNEIAELILFVNSLENKEDLINQIKSGSLDFEIEDEPTRKKLLKLINRAGIECKEEENKIVSGSSDLKERKIEVDGNSYWVDEQTAKEVEDLIRDLAEVGMKIQLKNAERQIKDFSEEEEKEFQEIQQKYLALIQKKKEIINKLKG